MDQKIKSKVNLYKLGEKKMKSVHAGTLTWDMDPWICYCACHFVNSGGAPTLVNNHANYDSGLSSPY